MSSTPTTTFEVASTIAPSHHHSHHLSIGRHHHSGKRLRHFLHPNGKKIHVAHSPTDFDVLRKSISGIEKDGHFDVVIHGSPEHVEALRETHAHHEERRNTLREKHNAVFEECEEVIHSMDALSNELHMISDHAVELDASFSRYGYSAHLRTHHGGSPNASSANSLLGDEGDEESDHGSHGPKDWEAERRGSGRTMKFFVKPVVRQYYHKGLLWRAQEQQEVASYELFVDLLYVGIIAIAGDMTAEEATGKALLRFVITLTMGFKIWQDISQMVNWFDADDIMRRIYIIFLLVCLLGMATNISECFNDTWTPLVACYITARLFHALSLIGCAVLLPMVRATLIGQALLVIIPVILWIGTIHIENIWHRLPLIFVTLFIEPFGGVFLLAGQRMADRLPWERFREWMKKQFEFFPGVSLEHRIERTGNFVTLVLGYSVVGLMYQNRLNATANFNDFLGKAILGLIQAFSLGWMYFEVDNWNLFTHAIRKSFPRAFVWVFAHLPFAMSYVLSGASLARLVLTLDTSRSPLDSLSETYQSRAEPDITSGARWFYCAGLGITLICLGGMAAANEHRTIANTRLKKKNRLKLRFAVAIVLICLPLASEEVLTSLKLVATTTSLIALVLMVDLYGASCAAQGFWWCRESFSEEGRKSCKYMARCRVTKKDLEASVMKGQVLNVEQVAKRERKRAKKWGRVEGRPVIMDI
ncbi:MAG: hypothetical protein M1820_010741 [Bogoriella megaspora]|nr:MAG: hypothetical protein M1820_010741 [Bogoriella megaspora]